MKSKICTYCGINYEMSITTCPNCGDELDILDPDAGKILMIRIILGVIGLVILSLIMLGLNKLQLGKEEEKFVECQSNCKILAEALRTYAKDHDGHYPDSMKQLMPEYISKIPICPNASRDSYSGSYKTIFEPFDAFSFYCGGEKHGKVVPGNYPQYHSEKGLVNEPAE